MGKPEREVVEKAEIIATRLINGEKITYNDALHPFFDIIREFAIEIRKKYPTIISAVHIGNSYDSRGDIKLKLPKKETRYIELKFLDSGKGTLANISQDALTKLGIFNTISWSEFRKQKKHKQTLIRLMNNI